MTKSMRISLCILAGNFLLYIYLIFLMLWPWQVYEFVTPVQPVGDAIIGRSLAYRMDVHKYVSVPAHSNTALVNDKYSINLDSHASNFAPGRRTSLSFVDLDPDIPPGRYKLRWSGTWHVNWLRNVTVTSESKVFEVKKR